jgi:hypothetical protein
VIELYGYVGGALLAFCALPLLVKTIRDGHARGVSLGFLLMWAVRRARPEDTADARPSRSGKTRCGHEKRGGPMSQTPLRDALIHFEKIDPKESSFVGAGKGVWHLSLAVAYILDHLRACERWRVEHGFPKVEP